MSVPNLTETEKAEVARFGLDKPERRTKRRFAYELYPNAAEDGTRPLSVEVPHLYARALGFEVHGTGWFDVDREISGARTMLLIEARQIAFLADALLQGMAGDEAWAWAQEYLSDETGELCFDRAEHYGVDPYRIKPYPCGAAPSPHEHLGEPDSRQMRLVTYAPGAEDDCEECTEAIS